MGELQGVEERVLSEAKGRECFKQVGMQKARLKLFFLNFKGGKKKDGKGQEGAKRMKNRKKFLDLAIYTKAYPHRSSFVQALAN